MITIFLGRTICKTHKKFFLNSNSEVEKDILMTITKVNTDCIVKFNSEFINNHEYIPLRN